MAALLPRFVEGIIGRRSGTGKEKPLSAPIAAELQTIPLRPLAGGEVR